MPDQPNHDFRSLDPVFAPKTVAVIGATEKYGSVGRTVLWNLISSPFGGTVFPVNPGRPNVLGIKAYATIADVPEPVDLAVIATPAVTVPEVIGACVDAGVRGAVVISAGFKEVGGTGAELEARILHEARRGPMRIIGPNCLGLMCPRTGLNATFAGTMARPGGVAFLSQSGALCTAILDWSLREHVGFSAFVSTGSMLDVGWGDLIDYLADDPSTRCIVIYMESIGDARAFLSAAREVALAKPIIVIKAGRTDAAALAAASHTGSLSGSDDVLDAAFRRCGVLRVDTISEVFYLAEVLAKQPRPRGPRLAIVTNAGGPGVLAVDALIRNEGVLARLDDATLARLDTFLPPPWSHANPIDILGDADASRYAQTIEAVADDPDCDGLLVILTPQAMTNPTATAEALRPFAQLETKPVLASWMGGNDVSAGEALLNEAGIPTFPYPDTAARVFNAMWRSTYNLRGLYETPTLPADDDDTAPARESASALISAARSMGRTSLTDVESRAILAFYQIPTLAVGSTPPTNPDAFQLFVGSRLDPQFGPVLIFGTGGPLGRVFKDQALALPPLNTTLARRMMEGTRIYQALKGVDGRPSVDLVGLEQLLVRFSLLVSDQPWIRAIEIHPLLAFPGPDGLRALDAQVLVHGPEESAESLPRMAIRPYPAQYVSRWTTKSGRGVLIRPIRPEDEPLIARFHETLSDRSVAFRFFHAMKLSARVSHERLTRICFIDYDREMALVAEARNILPGRHEILAVGRLSKLRGRNEAEFGLIVSDGSQGQGLGTELLRRMIAIGRDEHLSRITADILSENNDMRQVCLKLGFTIHQDLSTSLVRAVLDL